MISERTSLPGRMCTALIIAAGFAVLFAFALVWLNELRKTIVGASPAASYENLSVESDGTVLIGTYGNVQRTYRTLEGQPAIVDSKLGEMSPAYLRSRRAGDAEVPARGWEARVFPFADDAVPPTYWYYILAGDSVDGRGYFAGYNSETQRPAGYLGTNGFTATLPARDDQFSVYGRGIAQRDSIFSSWGFQFPNGMSPMGPAKFDSHFNYPPWIVYLHAGGRFLKIDLSRRTVSPAVNADDIVIAGQVSRPDAAAQAAGSRYPQTLETYVLRRADRITLFNPADETTEDFPLPAELRDRNFSFYNFPNHTALIDIWYWDGRTRPGEHDLVWLNADGAIRKEHLTLDQRSSYPSGMEATLLSALCIPGPLVGAVFFIGENAQDSFANAIGNQWLRTLLVLLMSAAATAVAAWKQRRAGQARGPAWLAFVFLLGIPGLVGYLFHRRWPIVRPLPPPQRTGIEVFA
jgi:hypothetical protein